MSKIQADHIAEQLKVIGDQNTDFLRLGHGDILAEFPVHVVPYTHSLASVQVSFI